MLDQNTLSILKSVINKHLGNSQYKAFVFGSRTKSKHRKFCDLDVGIMGSTILSSSTLLQIKEDLSRSDIPYLTDVVDFSTVPENFKKIALTNIISI